MSTTAPQPTLEQAFSRFRAGYDVAALAEVFDRAAPQGHNMTDVLGALGLLALEGLEGADAALASFYDQWRNEPLVLDKWLGLQAMSTAPDTLERVVKLTEHEAFSIKNPNKVRALIGTYSRNPVAFHRADGAGYRFVADQVLELDKLNPQVAARMVGAFNRWRRYGAKRAKLQKAQLERIAGREGLSRDVAEIAGKALEG